MGKSTTTTNQSSTSAAPQATAAYSNLLNQAQGVAATPYQAYTGELTAPINAEQQTGISGINAAAGQAQPGLAAASTAAGAATAPITAQQIQQYQNPYTQQVVNATEAQNQLTNQQQQASLTGNQISQGALGGNRVGVAQSNLATGQSLANNAQIANLYSSGYQQALGAAQAQQQTGLAGANAQANFAVQGQNAALTGAGAQLGAGTVQQQTQQQIDAANQAAYAQQQAYPFQTTQWLAGIDTGVAPGLGSSSTGQTTGPAPNQTAQYAGLGLAAASFLARGGGVHRAYGGGVQHRASGGISGTPWASAPTWVPTIGLGNAAPHAGSAPSAQNPTAPTFDYSKIISANNNNDNGLISGPAYGGGNIFTDASGGSSSNPLPGLDASDYGAGFAHGGGISGARLGYEDGGTPTDDPFGDDNHQIAYDLLRQGQGVQAPVSIPGGEPPPNAGVGAAWNPDQPYRMPDQPTVDSWRADNPLPPDGGPSVAQNGDDGALPPEVTRGSSRAPVGLAAASDDGTALGYAGAPVTTPQPAPVAAPDQPSRDSGLPHLGLLNISPNARSGLLAAGLGMLASRSSNLGNAIGEGGLAGLSAYSAANEHDQKVAQEAAKLSKEAQQHAEEMKFKTDTLGENIRHNKAGEENAADKTKYVPTGTVVTPDGGTHPLVTNQQDGKSLDAVTGKPPSPKDKVVSKDDKAPSGYQRTPDGALAFVKGGPHDPDVIAAETTARTKKGTELDDDTVDAIAQRVAQGDTRAVIGLGRNPAGIAQIQKRVAEIFKEQGLDHEAGAKAILGNIADQAGRMTAERTQAGIAAKLAVYGRNVDNAIGVATKASEAANRTQFTPVNVAINAFKAQTGDPKIVALGQSLNTLTNEYARAIGSGHGTVHDKEQAETQLNQARSHAQLVAIMNVMRQEIQMTKKSMPEAREEMRELYSRPSSDRMGTTAAPPIAGGFTPPQGAIARQANGKTYYYDPATKQPYPGQ